MQQKNENVCTLQFPERDSLIIKQERKHMCSQTFWISSYATPEQEGLIRCRFDPEKGFEKEAAYSGLTNPSFLLEHPVCPVLYTVEEKKEGAVCAWRPGRDSLRPLARLSTEGADPCHLSLSPDGRWLYAANYTGGSVACFRLDDSGIPTEQTDLRRHKGNGPRQDRQEAAHAHCVFPRQDRLLVCDLGTDEIVVYRSDRGILGECGRLTAPAGSGPRHLATHPAYPDLLFCVTELASTVLIWRATGTDSFELIREIPMLPADYSGANIAAAIRFTKDGRKLLVSHRGLDSIAVMPVSGDGIPGKPVLSPCVRYPRDFAIAEDNVIIASQTDGEVRAYRLHEDRLEETGMIIQAQAPVCLQPCIGRQEYV